MRELINKILMFLYKKNNHNILEGTTSCINGYIAGWKISQ